MAFEQTFKNIDNILFTDEGCNSELDYIEQKSWILFLKYLDDLEKTRAVEAALQEFVRHVIRLYIAEGIEELGTSKLPELLSMKYGSVQDGLDALGGMEKAKESFYGFQRSLYL